MTEMDSEPSEEISMVADNLTLANYNINNIKNNIAMKLFQREIDIKQELRNTTQAESNLGGQLEEIEKKMQEIEKERDKLAMQISESKDTNSATENRIKELEEQNKGLKANLDELEGEKAELNKENEKAEAKIQKLVDKVMDAEKEYISLKNELSKKPKKNDAEYDITFLKEFKKREAELKKDIRDEVKKWSKLQVEFSTQDVDLEKDSKKAIDEINKNIKALEKELIETEGKLKTKSKKDQTELNKRKTSIKQKITRAKKKHEKLNKDLKDDSIDPKKVSELKNELTQIINEIDVLQTEYNEIITQIELHQDDLYALFHNILAMGGVPSGESIEPPKDFDKVLNQSLEREKKLQNRLDAALKNVDELKSEVQTMDTDYYDEVKKEYERLYSKKEADLKKEYEKKMKSLEKGDDLKLEDKYKKELKKQSDKYKKDLELAAQRVFELKQYISQMETTQAARASAKASVEAKAQAKAKPTEIPMPKIATTPVPANSVSTIKSIGKQALPLRLPKQQPSIQGAPPTNGTLKNIIKPTVDNKAKAPPTAASKGGKQKKKRTQPEQLAQCGSCGKYIPVESNACPICGVSFSDAEEELGACGQCGNLIPVSVKKCPICGVKFE